MHGTPPPVTRHSNVAEMILLDCVAFACAAVSVWTLSLSKHLHFFWPFGDSISPASVLKGPLKQNSHKLVLINVFLFV